MKKIDVFISYSHKDKDYKDELLKHLRLLEKQGVAIFWDTSLISAGEDWHKEITKAVNKAEVVILLISQHFLASEYVLEQELPLLFKKAESRKNILLPILVSPTHWVSSIPELAKFQFLNDVRTPLSTSVIRDEDYANIAKAISDVIFAAQAKINITNMSAEIQMARIDGKKAVLKKPAKEKERNEKHVFLSHSKYDGDFAELMKLRLEKEKISAWIDNDRLEPGVDWRLEIDDSIKNATSLIVIMSPEARESEYVTYEWAYALEVGIKIVPVMLRETSLHPRLATFQYLDFTNRSSRPWEKLAKVLHEKL